MYAIKLKSDTENQRCIKDHQGHNTKTWPNVPCGPGASGPAAKLCRERETQVNTKSFTKKQVDKYDLLHLEAQTYYHTSGRYLFSV